MRTERATWTACLAIVVAAVSSAGAAESGTVLGRVHLGGDAPVRPPLEVFKSIEVCGRNVPDDRLVIGPGNGLRYVVVTVDGVEDGTPPERDLTHVLDNVGCRFEPHVQVAEVGQWLEIRNSDPILHNADARLGDETLFNVALPPGRRIRKPLGRPGLTAFTCNVRHTWMGAFVAVSDHRYHTVTDAYGAYEIRDVPPGSYTLRFWHEMLGTMKRPLMIQGGETATVDLTYPPPEAKR